MSISASIEMIFWLSVASLAYAYAGYPLLLWIVSCVRPRFVTRNEAATWTPSVTILITAYNEEKDIGAKLENTIALDYPPDNFEILVASDCSNDRTDEIVREFAARTTQFVIRLHRQPQRHGKTAAQNAAIELARGEIILFSDATTAYKSDVLRRIVPNFADATVGCVAGKLIYIDSTKSSTGSGAKSYWGYETFLKTHESRACSLIGASGCLYAVRRAAYVPMYPEACSDFLIATKMVEQNLRAVYEPRAVCTEETNRRTGKEFNMRVRVITQTYTDLWRHRQMMNPLRSGFYAVELVSHKVMRYAVPVLLIVNFLCALFLINKPLFNLPIYLLASVIHASVYVAAFAGWLLEQRGMTNKLLALPLYFVLANLAALVAAYKFARGERFASWEPIREPFPNRTEVEKSRSHAAGATPTMPPHSSNQG